MGTAGNSDLQEQAEHSICPLKYMALYEYICRSRAVEMCVIVYLELYGYIQFQLQMDRTIPSDYNGSYRRLTRRCSGSAGVHGAKCSGVV